MGVTIKQTHFEPLPVGEYPAKIGAIEASDGQYGPQLKIRFDITTPGLEDRSVVGWASAAFSPKSKLYSWARAAFGRDIPSGYDLNTDHLLDRPVTLVLVTKTGDDGAEFNKIHDVKMAKRNEAQPVRLTPVPAAAPAMPAMARLNTAAGVPVNVSAPAGPDVPPAWMDGNGGDEGLPF